MCDRCIEENKIHHFVSRASCSHFQQIEIFSSIFSCFIFLSTFLCVRAEGAMRTMSVEKLLKGMPTLQSQIDALLDFDVSDAR